MVRVAAFAPFSSVQTVSLTTTAPLPSPLSQAAEGAALGCKGSGDRQRFVQLHLLLAVDHHQEVHLALPMALRELRRLADDAATATARRKHRGGRGHDLEVLLVNERQLLLVHRVGAEPDTEGVEHHVLVAVGEGARGGALVENVRIENRHLASPVLMRPSIRGDAGAGKDNRGAYASWCGFSGAPAERRRPDLPAWLDPGSGQRLGDGSGQRLGFGKEGGQDERSASHRSSAARTHGARRPPPRRPVLT